MQQNPLNELVFIDSGVADADLLAASIRVGKEVVWLNSASDPWQQITQALSDHNNVSAIHIISHGNNGQINLGGINFDADALAARSGLLSSWQSYLADGADLLLYGCNIGNGETGFEFINTLSELTGTNVAASNDMTGSISFGGDWDLETATGTIEATPLDLASSAWQGALPTSTVYNANYQQLVFDNASVVSGSIGQDGSVVRYDNVISVGGQAIDAVMSVALSSGTTIAPSAFDPSNAGVSPDNFELSNLQVGSNNGYGTFTIAFYLHGTNTAVTLQNVAINSYDIDGNQFQEFRGFASYEVGNSGNTILTSTVQSDGSVRFQSNSTGNSVLTADQARVKVYYDSISTFQLRAGFGNNDSGVAFFSLDFSQGNPWTGAYSTINTPAPKVTYSATTFTEVGVNNGSIMGSSTITLTGGIGAAETFIPDGSGGVLGVNITNVPAGLTAVLSYVDSTHATLSFTGNAANHANIDDVNNVTVSFGNTSFSSGDASFVTGATRADLVLDYASPIPSIVALLALQKVLI